MHVQEPNKNGIISLPPGRQARRAGVDSLHKPPKQPQVYLSHHRQKNGTGEEFIIEGVLQR